MLNDDSLKEMDKGFGSQQSEFKIHTVKRTK